MEHNIIAIVVLFNPELNILYKQNQILSTQVSSIVYIDNASNNTNEFEREIRTQDHVHYWRNNENVGLGAAQNMGINIALSGSATHIILFDQDSLIDQNFVSGLLTIEQEYLSKGVNVGLVAPSFNNISCTPPILSDAIVFKGIQIKKVKLRAPMNVSYCIASGSLIRTDVLKYVGLINEDLFIDSLDLDWCCKAKHFGYEIIMTPTVSMDHRLGNYSKGKKVFHLSLREYYICRNSIFLLKYAYIPLGYKTRKFFLVPMRIFYSLCSGKFKHFRMGWKGIIDGIKGNGGIYRGE
jgi:rhamnosyltransferase